MTDLLTELQGSLCFLTIHREQKNNAFDDHLLQLLQDQFEAAIADPQIRVIVLKAQGKHFSAGADMAWMQKMAAFSAEDNLKDAMVLAKLMATIYHCPKPTIAMVQGSAYGGGAGLVAACDIGIAATNARFCFSEVKLGLIPAVISPFVIKAIGERAAKALFVSAEVFDAQRALALQLVQHCVNETELYEFTLNYAKLISNNAPEAVQSAKKLVHAVADKPIDEALSLYTAELIAMKRVSAEGQKGLNAFLHKQSPNWD